MDSQRKLEKFFSQFPTKKYKKGEILVAAEENPKISFRLLKGFIREYAISEEGEDLTIHLYPPGSFFPLMWVLNKIPNTHYFEALDDSLVTLTPHKKLKRFLRDNPEILFELTQRLVFGLHGLAQRIENISFGNAQVRVVSILLYLTSHFGIKQKRQITITRKFTHQEIATLTGLTRERVSLELEKLTKLNFVKYQNHHITLVKLENLKKLL